MRAMLPWTGMPAIKHEMDRLLEQLWEGDLPQFPGLAAWAPALDVAETKEAVTVKAEVPGMDANDIQLALQDQVLTLKGEKKQEKEEKDAHYYRIERTYGAFARAVRLPAPVDGAKVTAAFKNGLLTVTLPKTSGAKGTTIPIKPE